MFVKKFWSHVEDRLVKRQHLYFTGGTLCIDNEKSKGGGIGLNLDGKGFVYSSHTHLKNDTLYVPKHIMDLVHEIYKETKGSKLHKKRMKELKLVTTN